MTSAPKSAMMVVDTGPAMKLAASITRIPSRRRVMVRAPPVSRPVTRGYERCAPGKEYRDSQRAGRRGWVLGDGLCVPLSANPRQARRSGSLEARGPADFDRAFADLFSPPASLVFLRRGRYCLRMDQVE